MRQDLMLPRFKLPKFFSLLCLILSLFRSSRLQSIPYSSECESGTLPIFLLQHNVTNGIPLRSETVNNFIECSELCSTANDCVGVEYLAAKCHIIGRSEAQYHASANSGTSSRVLTKSCVKSEKICASPFHFDAYEQKILVGFAREVVPADNIHSCLSSCLNAFDTFGFDCESVMYYPVDAECILNTEDRLDRPDLFVDEHEDTVIYLDNNCAGSQCYAPYVTQYVAVENRQLHDELDRTVQDVDQESCEELCTQRLTTSSNVDPKFDFNCKSFMYNKDTRTCILSDERSKPLGRGNLTEVPGFNYYEKKCFASPRTCRNVPSFTRVPQMLLVGFASFVMENVPSVTMCLDQCTNPPPETGEKFMCKSVMYYYNEQECILNAESRLSKPDLFIPEEDDFVVDYFDINCHLETEHCPSGRENQQFYTIRTLNAALPEGDGSLHVLENSVSNTEECKNKCVALAPEKCRSFNYDKTSGSCNLMYLDGRGSLRPQPKTSIDLYDLHCLQSPKHEQTSSGCLSKDGSLYSRYLYTRQSGTVRNVQSSVALSKCLNLCTTSENCQGVNYNRRDGNCTMMSQIGQEAGEKHEHIDFYKNLCQTYEVDNGISSAINVPKPVEPSPTVQTQKTRLMLSTRKPEVITRPDKSPEVSGSEKQSPSFISTIDVPVKIEKPQPPVVAGVPNQPALNPIGSSAAKSESDPRATLTVSNSGGNSMPTPLQIPSGSVHTICNYEGIKVQVKHDQPFTGVMFVKNKYDSCRVEVSNSDSATLVLGLPSNFGMKPISLNAQPGVPKKKSVAKDEATLAFQAKSIQDQNLLRRHKRVAERDCGLIDIDNGTYKTVIVVQTNNLGIPGLVTSMDQLYEISCNYSSMLGGKVTAATNLTVHGPQPALIQPRGKIELGNPVLMQMNPIGVFGNASEQPLIQAKLGDILELRWEIMAMDEELDFFVRDCHAEPGVAGSNSKERLQLIEHGCPTPAVAQKIIPNPIQVQTSAVKIAHLQAFRFDSSSTVRITCHLELCKGNCKAVKCQLGAGEQDSWGRKKRELVGRSNFVNDDNSTLFETKRYKVPRFAQATTSLVIIDPLQQLTDPLFSTPGFTAHSSLSRQFFPSSNASANNISTSTLRYDPAQKQSNFGRERCMSKWTVGGILGTLFALIIVQSAVVLKNLPSKILFSAEEIKK